MNETCAQIASDNNFVYSSFNVLDHKIIIPKSRPNFVTISPILVCYTKERLCSVLLNGMSFSQFLSHGTWFIFHIVLETIVNWHVFRPFYCLSTQISFGNFFSFSAVSSASILPNLLHLC